MNSSFGGTARHRPRVNLGGNRRELTKEQLLRKAANDRQQREELRRQDVATQTIQRQWAVKKARDSALDVLRASFDDMWPVFIQHYTSGGTLHECLEGRPVFRMYRYFFHPKRDRRRTSAIQQFLQQIRSNQGDVEEACAQNLSIVLAPKFLRTHLDLIPWQSESANISEVDSLFATSVLESICTSMWWSTPRHRLFAHPVYCRAHYEVICGELLRTKSLAVSDPLSAKLITLYKLVYEPMTANAPFNAYSEFCRSVLPIFFDGCHPQLLSRLTSLSLRHLQDVIITSLTDNRYDEPVPDHLTRIKLERQLWSYLTITQERFNAQPSKRDHWIHVVCKLLDHIKFNSSRTSDSSSSQEAIEMDNTVSIKIRNFLTSPGLLTKLLLPTPAEYLSSFTEALFVYYPDHKEPLLLTLSMAATDPAYPYNILDFSFHQWDKEYKLRPIWSPDLALFLEILHRILLTMVDDEFFEPRRRPFTLDRIVYTAACLKEWVYHFMSHRPEGIDRPPVMMSGQHVQYVREFLARVLQQIQVRNARRQFLPDDFWLETRSVPVLKPDLALDAFQLEDEEDETRRRWPKSGTVLMLNHFPYMFPFHARIQSLHTLIQADVDANGYDDYWHPASRQHVTCRREHEFEDGFDNLWKIGGGIKGPLSVDYRDIHGLQEAGIDGGGLTKEFLTAACKQAFSPDFGLFVETPDRLLYPNPSQEARSTATLQQYQFLGRIIARCIYSNILVDVAFAPFFLLRWVGKLAYIDDLQGLDKDLYNGLIQLKNYPGDVENDLSLDFTVNEEDGENKRLVNLLPDGDKIPVTRQNRLRYIHLVCNYKLNARIDKQSQAFVRGMSEVLDLRWLSMFSQSEVQALVGGAPVPIDLDDLQQNTVYGGFGEDDVTVKIFWDVVRAFSDEEKRKLVKFVTSTPRPPLLGFKELHPKFSLRWAGTDTGRLPTASTCVNLLKLPAYANHAQMMAKLRLSINAEAGFDLS